MADNTKIEWADATLNYVNGCTRVSPGCVNCYAERLAATRLRPVPSRAGLAEMTPGGPRWTGKINIDDRGLDQALRWRRPRRIFWNAHGDLFHDSVPDEAIDRLFAVCALTPHHTHMILTKRAGRMREYMAGYPQERIDCDMGMFISERVDPLNRRSDDLRAIAPDLDEMWPLPNVWLGVSVEDQQRADERIPDLLATTAAVRFISAEPLLGPLQIDKDFFDWLYAWPYDNVLGRQLSSKIDWVIAGGESGPGARPMHPDWARSLRDQCGAAMVPFFFKQHGEYIAHPAPDATWKDGGGAVPPELEPMRFERVGKAKAARFLDGMEHNAFPEVRHD